MMKRAGKNANGKNTLVKTVMVHVKGQSWDSNKSQKYLLRLQVGKSFEILSKHF
jgi:hypothetical protein